MSPTDAVIFDYLTTFRSTLNLVGLAQQMGTGRTVLTEFLAGKRGGLSAEVQARFLSHFRQQAELTGLIPPVPHE
jgi:hypothetical protein